MQLLLLRIIILNISFGFNHSYIFDYTSPKFADYFDENVEQISVYTDKTNQLNFEQVTLLAEKELTPVDNIRKTNFHPSSNHWIRITLSENLRQSTYILKLDEIVDFYTIYSTSDEDIHACESGMKSKLEPGQRYYGLGKSATCFSNKKHNVVWIKVKNNYNIPHLFKNVKLIPLIQFLTTRQNLKIFESIFFFLIAIFILAIFIIYWRFKYPYLLYYALHVMFQGFVYLYQYNFLSIFFENYPTLGNLMLLMFLPGQFFYFLFISKFFDVKKHSVYFFQSIRAIQLLLGAASLFSIVFFFIDIEFVLAVLTVISIAINLWAFVIITNIFQSLSLLKKCIACGFILFYLTVALFHANLIVPFLAYDTFYIHIGYILTLSCFAVSLFISEDMKSHALTEKENTIHNLQEKQISDLNEFSETKEELLKKNMQLAMISESLKELEQNLKEKENSPAQTINSFLRKNNLKGWQEFDIWFKIYQPDFIKKLTSRFPELTPMEKRLCVFLKMNLSSKEIAEITSKSPNTVDVARHRIRQKMKLEKHQNLINFLHSFDS